MTNFSLTTASLRRGTGRCLVLALLAAAPVAAQAQTGAVGIGTTAPNASAALDVTSTTKGFLPPRLTTAQRDAIASPAAGLTIFNTTTGVLNTWDGTKWVAALTDTSPPLLGVTFAYTGGVQTYTVPAGVTALAVDMAGAAGGPVYSTTTGQGLGGRVQATLAVTPGQVLTVVVGGAGAPSVAGYNGGGIGLYDDGGGGGASDIRTGGAALPNRVLVAGGGGGDNGAGGAGGGLTGGTGGTNGNGGGGLGGSQSAGGAGGAAGSTYPAGNGGSGATGGAGSGNNGGGGGGYFGGGAGGGRAGGGGGSSYAGPGTSAVTHTQGVRSGDGYVTFSGLAAATAPVPVLDGSNITGVIRNQTTLQAGANFNISGNGTIGGNLGIGTTAAPSQKLEVAGQVFSSSGGFRFPDNSVQTTASTTAASTTASNGLTRTGNDLALGGTLTQATTIATAGNNFSLTGVGYGTSPGVLDQQQLLTPGSSGAADQWQSFTAGVSGQLTQLDLGVSSPTNANGAPGTLSVYAGQGTGGALLATQPIVYNAVYNTYQQYVLATPVPVVAGQQYTYRFEAPTISVGFLYQSGANPYAGGQASYSATIDFCFKTYVVQPVVTSVLTALATGNVGIGTASPSQALQVAGQIFSSAGGVRFPDNTVQTTAAVTAPATTASNGLTAAGNTIALGGTLTQATTINQGSNAFSLTGTGNVGVGASASTTTKLYVQAADNSTNPIATFQPLNQTQGVSLTYSGIAKTGTNTTSDLTLDGKSTGNILLHTAGSTGSVGIGTSGAPTQKLDVAGNLRLGTAGTVGKVITNTTGNNNMLAVAYGQTGKGSGMVYGSSGNFSVALTSPGVYTITFPPSSGLNTAFFDSQAVNVSLYGATPGFITFTGDTGSITVRTFTAGGVLSSNYYFSFSVFAP